MKKKNSIVLALAALFVSGLSALASTYYVDASKTDDSGDGASWSTAKKTIQAAVDLTVDGDIVWVAQGTYDSNGAVTPNGRQTNRVCILTSITLCSSDGPSSTFIVGAAGSNGSNDVDSVRGVYMGTNATLSGFTISGGYSTPNDSAHNIYADPGSGVYLKNGAVVSNCVISGNSSLAEGGGVYLYGDGLVTHCTIEGNVSMSGGAGAFLNYGGSIRDCVLSNNVDEGWNGGGGAKIDGQGGEILRSVIQGNYARSGGGVMMEYGGVLNNCLVVDNMANESGGGVSGSSSILNNCTIVENSVTNSMSSFGGGGFVSGMMGNNMLNNCILWGNTAVMNANLSLQPYGDSAKYCCTPSGEGITNGVNGCITSEPLFVDASSGNYQITLSSPCVNAGANEIQIDPYNSDAVTNVVALSATDLAGNARINNGTVDIGAYEQTTLLPSFVITTTTGEHGTISPSSPSVYQGFDQEFLIQPATAYQIESLLVDGSVVPVVGSYIFTDVQAAHTISATFSPVHYALSVLSGSGDGSYTNTEEVIISAELPTAGHAFSHWSVVPAEYTNNLASPTSIYTTFTMPYENVELTANYKDIIDVKNVMVAQRPGTKLVDISYDLFCGSPDAVDISLTVSNSMVAVNATSLVGDVGSDIAAGTGHSMLWDMGADWDGNVADLLFTVKGSLGSLDSYPGSKSQNVDSRNYILRVSSSEGGELKSHSGYSRIGNSGGGVRSYPYENTMESSYIHQKDYEFSSYDSSFIGVDWRYSGYGAAVYIGLRPGSGGGYSHIQVDSSSGHMTATASAHNRGGPSLWIDDDGDTRLYSTYQTWGYGGSEGGTHRLYEITGSTPFLITINMSYEGSLESELGTSADAESITLVTRIKNKRTYFNQLESSNWGFASDVLGNTNAYDWIFGEDQDVAEFLGQLYYSNHVDPDTELMGELDLAGQRTMSFLVHPGDLILIDDFIFVQAVTMNPTKILPHERRARVDRFSVNSELLIAPGSDGGLNGSDHFEPDALGSPFPSVGIHSNYCWMSMVTCTVSRATGYTNKGWVGTGSVPPVGDTLVEVPVVLSTPDSSIAWNWEFEGYALTVLNGTGSGLYTNGAVVSISADPTNFYCWSGDNINDLEDIYSPSTTLRMPAEAITLTPVYLEPVMYVNAAMPDDLQDGTSWATAKKTIQAAIEMVAPNGTVWVTNGVYDVGGAVAPGGTQTNRVCITRPMTVRSVNGADVTSIVGDSDWSTGRCVYMTNGCSLIGFTITEGSAAGVADSENYGGGLFMTEGCLAENCTIVSNWADFVGGGVYLSGGGTLNNSIVRGNGSDVYGCGIGISGGTVNNCLVDENWGGGQAGGLVGVHMDGGTLNNSTVVSNQNRGGVSGRGTVQNCIVWGNYDPSSPDEIPDISITNGVVRNTCALYGVVNGVNGCITSDPKFMNPESGDFQLMGTSPCLDIGDNAAALFGTDLAGNMRIVNGTVDFGAYERIAMEADDDSDGIPNWWELRYFGGITNAPALQLSSNGVNTVREAFIAGIDPTDPHARFVPRLGRNRAGAPRVRWPLAQGRIYSIYWAPSLTNSFHWIADVPWTEGEFIDELHIGEGAGFYKVEVREDH